MERQGKRPETLADFLGCWRMRRTIRDFGEGRDMVLSGLAEMRATPDGAVCREMGKLAIPGQKPLNASQTYFWRLSGRLVHVLFSDRRDFHSFDLEEACPTAEHCCGSDLYRVRYHFEHWPTWRAVWNVKGPRKSYRMETEYWSDP